MVWGVHTTHKLNLAACILLIDLIINICIAMPITINYLVDLYQLFAYFIQKKKKKKNWPDMWVRQQPPLAISICWKRVRMRSRIWLRSISSCNNINNGILIFLHHLWWQNCWERYVINLSTQNAINIWSVAHTICLLKTK